MEIFYFFVRQSKAWDGLVGYHENFFIHQGGFMMGFLGALIFGIIVACVFYFGCCNSKKTSKYATISAWAISLAIAAVIGYFYADLVIIGKPKAEEASLFRRYSFYQANKDYCIEKTKGSEVSETSKTDFRETRDKIDEDLSHYRDVRFSFDMTTAVLAILFFFLTSLFVKRFTINGRSIPFLKP